MPELFVYLLKVNAILILFYLAWHFLLKPLTFYKLNRFFLVFGILFSTSYPVVNISKLVENHPQVRSELVDVIPDWTVYSVSNATVGDRVPASFNYWLALEIAFWAGVILMSIRFGIQLLSLFRLHRNSIKGAWKQYSYRDVLEPVNPFSFLGIIYLHARPLNPSEMDTVLAHEEVHVREWHTADVLLSELSTIFYWFNPGAWLMKNAIKENLEFITDYSVLQKGADRKEYQYSLLKIAYLKQSSPIVNHFSLLTLKNRITMMNKKRSSPAQLTKYLLALPLVLALALVFTVTKAQLEGKTVSEFIEQSITNTEYQAVSQPAEKQVEIKKDIKSKNRLRAAVNNFELDISNVPAKRLVVPASVNPDTVRYFIDGKPGKDLNGLNPQQILEVNIYKAPMSSRIFGSEYSGGVISIITKENKDSEAVKDLKLKLRNDRVDELIGRAESTRPASNKEVTVVGYGTQNNTGSRV